MSDNNEELEAAAKTPENKKSENSVSDNKEEKPSSRPPRKRSSSRSRKPAQVVDSEESGKGDRVEKETSGDTPEGKDQNTSDSSDPEKRKQPARRPSRKRSDSNRRRSDRAKGDERSDGADSSEGSNEAGSADSNERRQGDQRSGRRKNDSNRRRSASSSRSSSRGGGRQNRPRPSLRLPPVDPEELQSKAWELYRADVNEESTAMFNEEEAVDLVRRSFILADIFLRFRDDLYHTGSSREGENSPAPAEQEQVKGDSAPEAVDSAEPTDLSETGKAAEQSEDNSAS